MNQDAIAVGVVTLDPARFVATMGRTWATLATLATLKEDVPPLR